MQPIGPRRAYRARPASTRIVSFRILAHGFSSAAVSRSNASKNSSELSTSNLLRLFRQRRERGAALIIALALTLCLTTILVGTQLQVVTQLKSSKGQRDYDRALQLAEAGANAYLNYLSALSSTTSLLIPWSSSHPAPLNASMPSTAMVRTSIINGTVALGYNADGTVGLVNYPAHASLTTKPAVNSQYGYYVILAGAPGNTVTIVSYGYANGIVRRIKVVAQGTQGGGDFAIYGINSLNLAANDTINGNAGSNGALDLSSNDTVTGKLFLGGSAAAANSSAAAKNPTRLNFGVVWPTVDQIANRKFPGGGLTWLATHNDNALNSAIDASGAVNQTHGTVTFPGKSGGANYYVTSISIGSNTTMAFDNAAGPVTIWVGPAGSTNGVQFSSNVTFSNTSTSASNPVRFYVATKGPNAANTGSFDTSSNIAAVISVYAFNGTAGNYYGDITSASNMTLNGTYTAYDVNLKSNDTVIFPTPPGVYTASEVTNYSVQSWTELL